MTARIVDGWLVVPYSGPELVPVAILIGGDRCPAFLDWHGGERVAKIRPPTGVRGVCRVEVQTGDNPPIRIGHIRLPR